MQASRLSGRLNAVHARFRPAFYLELVNRAYAKELEGTPIALADLPAKPTRITKRIDAVFAKRKLGKLNHYRPASTLLRNQGEFVPRLDDATRSRFETLVQRINQNLT